ncbi:MAG: hypothetical protein ACXWUG_31905 [Polyangiales bacterium]
MRRRVSLAVALSLGAATTSFALKTSALDTRPSAFKWDKNVLRGAFSFDDAINDAQKKRLANGLAVTVVMRGYVIPNAGGDPIALTAHTCTIGYDLWQQIFFVVVNNGKKSAVVNLAGVLKRCTQMKDLPIADKPTLKNKPTDYYLAVHVEVNPKSQQLLNQIQGWVTRPLGVSGSISPGDALFATFVGVFIKQQTATADVVIDFQTSSFPAAP